ncbi:hypothetical protein GH714_038108 [Hevea brasiliensis]|uniref:RNase III domain-containing protein n=1 Tax=Hevea brasiliensis TaxID=3981 RepID=A0A6A6LTN0_HEVBR|nr:hypothetical protein GH714_038108 [Hevea brasiliensis]
MFSTPLPGSLVRGAQRLRSIMRRAERMLLAIQLKDIIDYSFPPSKVLYLVEFLQKSRLWTIFSFMCPPIPTDLGSLDCSFMPRDSAMRAELLGDAYLKWVVTRFLFLQYPLKHEGQLTRMRQQMVSNMILYQYALNKGLQSYIQADRFAPSRWAAPGVLPVFDEDTKDGDCTFFDQERSSAEDTPGLDHADDGYEDDEIQDGELESDSSSYRVLSSKTLADVVEALIGVYYVEGGENAANHLMKWIRIQIRDFVKEVQDGLSQPGFNSFGWEIAKLRRFLVTLLNLMRVLFCGTMDEILQLFGRICSESIKKMAQKLAARNALAVLKEKETAEAKDKGDENGKKKKNGNQKFARQILNDICLRINWPMPFYR